MQIIAPGQSMFPPRFTFAQLYSNGVTEKPLTPKRLKITVPTAIRGTPVYPGTVLQFDTALPDYREDYGLLLGSLKAERVPLDTPLVIAPAPVEPPPLPAAERKESAGVMEMAKALVAAMREGSPAKASKA